MKNSSTPKCQVLTALPLLVISLLLFGNWQTALGQCSITSVTVSNLTCNNNAGTTTDQCDDYNSFNLTVLNDGGGSCVGTYTVSVPAGNTITPATGTFGVATAFQLVTGADPGTVTITINDGVSAPATVDVECCVVPNSSTSNTTGCQVTLIDSNNNGASAGANGNEDCSPCATAPPPNGDTDSEQFCAMFYIDLYDILGTGATCGEISITAATGGIYNYYVGMDLICASDCPTPYATDIPNNVEVVISGINPADYDCGLFPVLLCAESGGGNRSLTIEASSCCTTPTVSTVNACVGGGNVTFTQSGGTPGGAWSVNGGGTINATTGVFTPTTPGCYTATYTFAVDCFDSENFVVYPAAPSAPTVNAGCGAIVVTPPPSVVGFRIEYSFDNGVSWGSNTPPTADNCTGYSIKTRYVLDGVCGNTPDGTPSSNPVCEESPATVRVVDTTPPVIACPANITSYPDPGLCTAVINYAGFAVDDCEGVLTPVTIDGPASGDPFPIGITTVTLQATDGCANDATCTFNVTVTDPVVVTIGVNEASFCKLNLFALSELNGQVLPNGLGGYWTSSGTGQFLDASDNPDNSLENAVVYQPSQQDIDNGSVIITLHNNNPGGCPEKTDSVIVEILDVGCGTFPWDGN